MEKESAEQIIVRKCQYCGKRFKSFYENQANNWLSVHELTCESREKKDDKEHLD